MSTADGQPNPMMVGLVLALVLLIAFMWWRERQRMQNPALEYTVDRDDHGRIRRIEAMNHGAIVDRALEG